MFAKHKLLAVILAAAAPAMVGVTPAAWAQSQPTTSTRLLGTITSLNGNEISVKTDSGQTGTVHVADSARILRMAPGQKTLAGASKIQMSDLSVGDRVLIVATPGSDGAAATATTVIAMKQADIAEKQKAEEADWQKRGVGGLVKSVDPATDTVAVSSGRRTLEIKVTPSTAIRRYATDSIKFSDAVPSTLDQIKPGDQLRARGDRSPDGSEITAEEIVSGSFRNIAGTVTSVDAANGTVSVTPLGGKAPVLVHATADSQLKKLDPNIAQMIAARLKSGPNAEGGQHAGSDPHAGEQAAAPAPHPAADFSRVLQQAPPIQLSDLHKGDAVMIVATSGNPDSATAITLLAGVEPMFRASTAASQSMFSASWNVGGQPAGGDESGSQ